MASLNRKSNVVLAQTHEGARAHRGTAFDQLSRTLMCCMLWEDNFYEDGQSVAQRIQTLVPQVRLEDAAQLAILAREQMHLRHAPLLVVREMARHHARSASPRIVSETLARVIQRPDELSEFLSIYWTEGKCPISKQVKLGLAKAFQKFNEYQLAKYNRKKDIMLRDVLFLCHSKPIDVEPNEARWDKNARQIHANPRTDKAAFEAGLRPNGFAPSELLYGKLIYDQLDTPDTWEVELSAKGNNAGTWLRLMQERKLGDLAFLRNLRNMLEAKVNIDDIRGYGDIRQWGRILPFRFIAAAKQVPSLEPHIEQWMLKCMQEMPRLSGTTGFLIDVSGSMFGTRISAKSDLDRFDAAAALAILGRGVCEHARIFSFSNNAVEVPARHGFALRDAIKNSQQHGGTYLGKALTHMKTCGEYDRIIVLTDEQSSDTVNVGNTPTYIINVAAYQNGVAATGNITRISGWSEAVFDFITQLETAQ